MRDNSSRGRSRFHQRSEQRGVKLADTGALLQIQDGCKTTRGKIPPSLTSFVPWSHRFMGEYLRSTRFSSCQPWVARGTRYLLNQCSPCTYCDMSWLPFLYFWFVPRLRTTSISCRFRPDAALATGSTRECILSTGTPCPSLALYTERSRTMP